MSFWWPDQQNSVILSSDTWQPSNGMEKVGSQTDPVWRVFVVRVVLKDKLGKGSEDMGKREIEVMNPKVEGRLGRKGLNEG